MIKIRYSDLPAGLHASASSEGRHTIIYLLPGLSAADRRGAIDRLRASAKVGHGPKLSTVPLARALIADRIRTNLRNAVAAARLHPVGAAIPVVVLAAGAILYALFVTVSIRIGPLVPAAAPAPQPASVAPANGAPGTGPTSVFRLTGAGPANSSQRKAGRTPGQGTGASAGRFSGGSPSPGPSVSSPQPGHSSPSPGSPSPSPSPSPTNSHGACLNVVMFGICLNA